jgi:hypothetical protein
MDDAGITAGAAAQFIMRRIFVWLVPVLLTLHNAEEAIAFRQFMPRLPALLPEPFARFEARLDYSTMLVALIVLSLIAFALALLVSLAPSARWRVWLLMALQASVALNVVAHVLSAAFVFHGYAPGLITALAINAPFSAVFFRRATRERWVSPQALRALVPAALVLHGPVLFGGLWLAGLGK